MLRSLLGEARIIGQRPYPLGIRIDHAVIGLCLDGVAVSLPLQLKKGGIPIKTSSSGEASAASNWGYAPTADLILLSMTVRDVVSCLGAVFRM